jgi:hypothetical protein
LQLYVKMTGNTLASVWTYIDSSKLLHGVVLYSSIELAVTFTVILIRYVPPLTLTSRNVLKKLEKLLVLLTISSALSLCIKYDFAVVFPIFRQLCVISIQTSVEVTDKYDIQLPVSFCGRIVPMGKVDMCLEKCMFPRVIDTLR